MHTDYHHAVTLRDFVIGKSRSGKVWCRRYTKVGEFYSDYPLWEFCVDTIGM